MPLFAPVQFRRRFLGRISRQPQPVFEGFWRYRRFRARETRQARPGNLRAGSNAASGCRRSRCCSSTTSPRTSPPPWRAAGRGMCLPMRRGWSRTCSRAACSIELSKKEPRNLAVTGAMECHLGWRGRWRDRVEAAQPLQRASRSAATGCSAHGESWLSGPASRRRSEQTRKGRSPLRGPVQRGAFAGAHHPPAMAWSSVAGCASSTTEIGRGGGLRGQGAAKARRAASAATSSGEKRRDMAGLLVDINVGSV